MTTARARTRPFLPLFRRPLSPKPYLLLLSPAAPLSQRPSPFLPPLLSLPLSPLPAAVCPRPHNASPPASGVEQVLPVTAVNVATVAALSALWAVCDGCGVGPLAASSSAGWLVDAGTRDAFALPGALRGDSGAPAGGEGRVQDASVSTPPCRVCPQAAGCCGPAWSPPPSCGSARRKG